MKVKKRVIYAGILSSVVCAGAYAALWGNGPAEAWTMQQITTVTTTVVEKITVFGSTFNVNLTTKFDQLVSAVAVATKQEALAGNSTADTIRETNGQLLNAFKTNQLNSNLARVVADYGGVTGQGYDPCGTFARTKTLDLAFSQIPQRVSQRMQSFDVGAGKLGDPNEVEGARVSEHLAKFCSQAEADAGLCTVSELPGADSNAALFFQAAEEGSLESDARKAYIQNILGSPNRTLADGVGKSVAGQSYFNMTTRKDSLQSIPAYSLAWIDVANTRTPELQNKSPNEVLQLRVNQYFGGSESIEWAKALARQTDRGLLVEANKMAGLRTWMSHNRYRQNQRIEANLAVLLVLAGQDANQKAQAAGARTVSENISGAVNRAPD